ncbi:MAG: hypothetical protein P0116_10255 [Candidatus Nitrosocosmicus sp.]|nr:hypothetical protein [Candidatus Nitrosocosmicus sp.]
MFSNTSIALIVFMATMIFFSYQISYAQLIHLIISRIALASKTSLAASAATMTVALIIQQIRHL